MCFNLSLNLRREKATRIFGVDPGREWGPGFLLSAFEHPEMPVLVQEEGVLQFRDASWGLIPSWADAARGQVLRKQTLNARSEEIWEKPSFRESAEKSRILIPFTGFFEWKTLGKEKIPWYFRFREGEGAGFFAGLLAGGSGTTGATFTLLTGAPNQLVGGVHERSPVRIFPEQRELWLDPRTSRTRLEDLFRPRDWPDMESYPVGPLISRRNVPRNVPEVLLPRDSSPAVDGQLGLF